LRGGFSELSTLKVGEKVQVLGVPVRPAASNAAGTPTRTLEAWALRVDSGATGFFHGRVARVDGNTLVVNNARGRDRITISVDAGTQYKRITVVTAAPVIAPASLADVRPGGYLAVEGVVSPDGRTIQARAVMLLGSPLEAGNLPPRGHY
jgi:hypothetical protein